MVACVCVCVVPLTVCDEPVESLGQRGRCIGAKGSVCSWLRARLSNLQSRSHLWKRPRKRRRGRKGEGGSGGRRGGKRRLRDNGDGQSWEYACKNGEKENKYERKERWERQYFTLFRSVSGTECHKHTSPLMLPVHFFLSSKPFYLPSPSLAPLGAPFAHTSCFSVPLSLLSYNFYLHAWETGRGLLYSYTKTTIKKLLNRCAL